MSIVKIIYNLVAMGKIRGDGFFLVVKPWDDAMEGGYNKIRFKVYVLVGFISLSYIRMLMLLQILYLVLVFPLELAIPALI